MRRKLIILLPLIVLVAIVEAEEMQLSSNSFSLELIHRHAYLFNHNRPLTQHQRLKELLRHDIIRHNITSHRLQHRRPASPIELPLNPGSDLGIGQYVTTLKVGTPSQMFRVIVDTGSDLTSVRCRYRCSKRAGDCTKKGRINGKRVFNARLSSSFSPVPCSSQRCKVELMTLFSIATCPAPLTPCAYDYGYLISLLKSDPFPVLYAF
ncbi:hypothetical protein V6N12_015156 [Hibiscus sabdariffa]|uniref:Peptidase A1 domain-containing protein n=1 Tax=Hibiscus sabdariffa TaxID=183260 RepID=A0ABR2DMB7_9ROSI